MSPREQRIIHNEALFREVNVHIAHLEDRDSGSPEVLPLICECSQVGCAFPIGVDVATFERVREQALQFFVYPGHERPDVESIVERRVGYLIVEKHLS